MRPISADLLNELADVQREAAMLASSVVRFGGEAGDAGDAERQWVTLSGIAAGSGKIYSGMERILRRIASEIDGHVSQDDAWHITLLRRMAAPLPGVREAVLAKPTLALLDGLRAFRHRERYSYVMELDPERVLAVAAEVGEAMLAFEHDLRAFVARLESPAA